MRKAPSIGERSATHHVAAPSAPDPLEQFVGLSVALTGFNRAELHATGMARRHLEVMLSTLGESLVGLLLMKWSRIANYEPYMRDVYLTLTILGDNTIGPMARNLTMLWYLGQWSQMPREWRDVHGAHTLDTNRIVSAEAYRESLVWATFRGHPQGAKAPGYGSWAVAPDAPRDQ